MTVQIRPAVPDDLDLICRLRLQRSSWLAARGSDQWSTAASGLPIDYFARAVARAVAAGETWIAEVNSAPTGTITVNNCADKGLWTPTEIADSLIVHYLIVDLSWSGSGIGRRLLAHAAELARTHGRSWVRLDAWTTNTDLHIYYRRAGFRMVRVADPTSPSPSCALFERHVDSWVRDDHALGARSKALSMAPPSRYPNSLSAFG